MIVVRPILRRALAATGLLVAAWAAPARGDTCGDCGPPSDATFRDAMGGALRDEGESPDTWDYEGGACTVAVGPVVARLVGEEMIAVDSGEAWACPDKVRDCRALYELNPSDIEWTLTSAAGGDLGPTLLAGMVAGAKQAGCPASGPPPFTKIDAIIKAVYCYTAPWTVYVGIDEYEATADYAITRTFTWWVRNPAFGDLVLATGTVEHPCTSGTAGMRRMWPSDTFYDIVAVACSVPCTPRIGPGYELWPYVPEDDEPKPTGSSSGSTTSTPPQPSDGGTEPQPENPPPLPGADADDPARTEEGTDGPRVGEGGTP
jgi:hypothetical protein